MGLPAERGLDMAMDPAEISKLPPTSREHTHA